MSLLFIHFFDIDAQIKLSAVKKEKYFPFNYLIIQFSNKLYNFRKKIFCLKYRTQEERNQCYK